MHYSNVQVVDQKTKQPVRVVFKYNEKGDLVRVKKTAGASPSPEDILPTPKEEEEEVSNLGKGALSLQIPHRMMRI